MKFLSKHHGVFRGFFQSSICLLLVFVIVFVYTTGTYRSKIDEFLGTNSGSVEHSADLADYEYQSDYDSVDELMAAEVEYNTRTQIEGSVLLKGSTDDLQIGEGANVTLFGMKSRSLIYNSNIGGTSNSSLCVRLDTALEDRGINVNSEMVSFYGNLKSSYSQTSFTEVNEIPQSEYSAAPEETYSEYSDAAIIVLGRACSEGTDFAPGEDGISNPDEFSTSKTRNILGLSDDEKDLIEYVKEQGFDKIIILINSANTMEIDDLAEDDDIDVILWIGTPGCYGTYGVADLLAGNALPSGHLSDTYYVNTASTPAAQNLGQIEYTNQDEVDSDKSYMVVESEGIYVGYKYCETRYYDIIMENGDASSATAAETAYGADTWVYEDEVTYSFGYGIEGSVFSEEITDINIDWTGTTDSTVTVSVTNTGDIAAKHVVQLYVQSPYTDYDKSVYLEKSAIQLVGYGKTGEASESDFTETVLLEPGETEEIAITFNAKDFSSYDSTYEHDDTEGAYLLETGDYYFATGNGAHDAVQAVIKAQDETKLTDVEVTGDVVCVTNDNLVAYTEGEDGYIIENQLEVMDFTNENYGDAFTSQGAQYLTRQDWSGTFPKTITNVTANDYMIKYLNNNFYDSEDANASYTGTIYTEDDFGTEGVTGDYTAADLAGVTDYNDSIFDALLSLIPLSDYCTYLAGANAAISEIYLDHANAADSPNGMIYGYGLYTSNREPFALDDSDENNGVAPNVYVGEVVVAATFSHLLASEEGRLIGNDGLWVGVYWWFGPGMNLHRTAYNGRNNEYYSEDSVLTGCMATDVTIACQEKGVIVCAKHYAFNDQETVREGVGVFTSEQAARENELRGFEFAVTKGGMLSVMTGFNRVGVIHTSMCYGLISGILRGEWGHNGLVITDSVKDKSYMLAAESVMAGTDFILGGNGTITEDWSNISEENVVNDPALLSALREAMHHYLYTMSQSALVDGYTDDIEFTGTVWWETALMGCCIGFAILTAVFGALYICGAVDKRRRRRISYEGE